LDFNLRFAPASTADQLMQQIEATLHRHGLDYEMRWTLGAQPFLTRPGSLVAAIGRAIEETTGRPPQLSTTGGTSDGRFLATVCPQVVEFGPTNATIHKVNECVRLDEIEPLKDVYRRTLELLLSGTSPQ
jgi:succinyl-diaminopimelate desuccinylase